MAKCKGCGNESRVLNDMKITVIQEVNGKPYSTVRKWTSLCDDCVRDSLYHTDTALEELSVAEITPTLKG